MDDPLKMFLAEAKQVSLTADEKVGIRDALKVMAEQTSVSTSESVRQLEWMENALTNVGQQSTLSLKPSEREKGKRELTSFMNEHPATAFEEEIFEPSFMSYIAALITGALPRTAVLACLFLLVGTGAAAAAESAVPGDFLYPFKVEVVERVRTGLAITPTQKAAWEATRALRRLEEAEAMAASSEELTDDDWMGLSARFEERVDEAKKHIEEVSKVDTERAQTLTENLDRYVKTHEKIIETIGVARRDNPDITEVIEAARETKADTAPKETSSAGSSEVDVRMEDHTRDNAAAAMGEALELIKPLRTEKDMKTRSDARAKLYDAEAMLQEADAQYAAGFYDESLALAREAQVLARETERLLLQPADE